VAKAVGVTQKHLSQVERGHVPMASLASGTVVRFARLFGVSTDYLLGLRDVETAPPP
jgi:transcriptional regulator with XRE-family HTH domain